MVYLAPFLLIAIGSAFEHEQALHAKNFRGESQNFCTALWLSVYASWACRIAIFAFIGIKLSLAVAVAMFIGGIVARGVFAGLLSGLMCRIAGPSGQEFVSLTAFVAWPTLFFAAYLLLPKVV